MRARGALSALIVAATAACGGAAPAARPTRPSPTVVVTGTRAHALGLELARDGAGRVEVAYHDGRRGWVDGARVRTEEVGEGTRVVVRWSDSAALYEAVVLARMDDLLRVRFDSDGSVALVPLTSALALLDAPLPGGEAPAGDAPDDPEDQAAAAPPVDPARQVIFSTLDGWVPGRAVRCDDGVTVLMPDGSSATVPFSAVSPAPLAVGDRVAARYQGGALSWLARVEELREGQARVRYEDDASEEWLEVRFLSLVLRPAVAPSASRAAPAFCRQLRGSNVPAVLVRRHAVGLAAEVRECAAGEVVLADRQGGAHTLEEDALRRLAPSAGDLVLVPWGQSFFLATVTAIDGTTLAVRYEDGSDGSVSLRDVHMHLLPADGSRPRPPYACE